MRELDRVREVPVLIPLFAAVVMALPGCDSSQDDFKRAQAGSSLKTPTEVRLEAEAKYGPPKKPQAPPDASKKPRK
jgi:hypothetical protein